MPDSTNAAMNLTKNYKGKNNAENHDKNLQN